MDVPFLATTDAAAALTHQTPAPRRLQQTFATRKLLISKGMAAVAKLTLCATERAWLSGSDRPTADARQGGMRTLNLQAVSHRR